MKGIRFRRSFKVAPGLRVNIGKGSVGLSAGVRGARISANTRTGARASVGLPGTGLRYEQRLNTKASGGSTRDHPTSARAGSSSFGRTLMWLGLVLVALLIMSNMARAQANLFEAVRQGTADEVRTILATEVDVNMADEYGQTPLMYASVNPDPEVFSLLVEAGADINALTLAGWTALMYAARDTQNPEVILRLLSFSPISILRNSDGQNALHYANQNQHLRGTQALMSLLNYYNAELASASPPPPPQQVQQQPAPRATAPARNCCRYCTTGKPCGNSCINRNYTCRQPPGCACWGSADDDIYADGLFFEEEFVACELVMQ